MSSRGRKAPSTDGPDLDALAAVSAAVEAGAGLPEVVRAAARALDASVVLFDGAGAVLAVAARSPADERSLAEGADGVESHELRVADEVVGRLRMRSRSTPAGAVVGLVKTVVAAEVRRVQAPGRASGEAAGAFVRALLDRGLAADAGEVATRAGEAGIEVASGAGVLVVRAQPRVPTDGDWRGRVLALAERGARATVPTALAAGTGELDAHLAQAVVLLPGAREPASVRAGELVARELESGLPGFAIVVGRSRFAPGPAELRRAVAEAMLAANVAATGESAGVLAFEDTGAYRLLLGTMSEDPAELERFYAETVEPLAAYDEQYETELVRTLETFLESDGNVAGAAQRLFTHRHTVRYRLERIRDLCGLDVGSTDGRERLSLGLKAMRVLGIAAPRGPATEAGSEAGRVPGGPRRR